VLGGACSTLGRGDKLFKLFWSKNLKGTDHSENLGVDERIIFLLDWISEK